MTGTAHDLGHGVSYVETTCSEHPDTPCGIIETHPNRQGEPCRGGVLFDMGQHAMRFPSSPRWRVAQRDPLTLEPSLACRTCGHHGWIRDGQWVPA